MFKLIRALSKEPLLYVPLSRGGEPKKIVRARTLQSLNADLLKALPRLGLWSSTCRLLETAWEMETGHKVGRGAVSEFDWLFATGFQALVESLVACVEDWAAGAKAGQPEAHFDAELIELVEMEMRDHVASEMCRNVGDIFEWAIKMLDTQRGDRNRRLFQKVIHDGKVMRSQIPDYVYVALDQAQTNADGVKIQQVSNFS